MFELNLTDNQLMAHLLNRMQLANVYMPDQFEIVDRRPVANQMNLLNVTVEMIKGSVRGELDVTLNRKSLEKLYPDTLTVYLDTPSPVHSLKTMKDVVPYINKQLGIKLDPKYVIDDHLPRIVGSRLTLRLENYHLAVYGQMSIILSPTLSVSNNDLNYDTRNGLDIIGDDYSKDGRPDINSVTRGPVTVFDLRNLENFNKLRQNSILGPNEDFTFVYDDIYFSSGAPGNLLYGAFVSYHGKNNLEIKTSTGYLHEHMTIIDMPSTAKYKGQLTILHGNEIKRLDNA